MRKIDKQAFNRRISNPDCVVKFHFELVTINLDRGTARQIPSAFKT
jgi:hypothetical protein